MAYHPLEHILRPRHVCSLSLARGGSPCQHTQEALTLERSGPPRLS
jgi:hypothetical protein